MQAYTDISRLPSDHYYQHYFSNEVCDQKLNCAVEKFHNVSSSNPNFNHLLKMAYFYRTRNPHCGLNHAPNLSLQAAFRFFPNLSLRKKVENPRQKFKKYNQ